MNFVPSILTREGVLQRDNLKPISYDVTWNNQEQNGLTVLFIHGFKGFKDWGIWNAVAKSFARKGYRFIKINLSHNGTTPENLTDFADLEAFGNNNFSREVQDIHDMLAAIKNLETDIPGSTGEGPVVLLGHSRGGASALIAAAESDQAAAVITWASIADITERYGQYDEGWEKEGVKYVPNSRTGQEMPLYFQLYADIQSNKGRFDLQSILQNFNKPLLICHGEQDETVAPEDAHKIKTWKPDADIYLDPESNHVFNGSHPYTRQELPEGAKNVTDQTLLWLESLSL